MDPTIRTRAVELQAIIDTAPDDESAADAAKELHALMDQADMLTFSQYMCLVAAELVKQPDWRVGQAFYNILRAQRPDLAEKVDATDLDPYYEDSNLTRFLHFIRNNW